jgi:hypothetical protein
LRRVLEGVCEKLVHDQREGHDLVGRQRDLVRRHRAAEIDAAAIVGGAVGLYAALSARNPSPAIAWASALLPALTFVAITGFLQGNPLQVLIVTAVAYGFATLALLVPAIGAFDLLTGRTTTGE